MSYGLLAAGQDQFNQAIKGLDSAAQSETQRNVANDQIQQQAKAGKAQLGATLGSAAGGVGGGLAAGAVYGSAAGSYGAAAGALIGGIAGFFGARLF